MLTTFKPEATSLCIYRTTSVKHLSLKVNCDQWRLRHLSYYVFMNLESKFNNFIITPNHAYSRAIPFLSVLLCPLGVRVIFISCFSVLLLIQLINHETKYFSKISYNLAPSDFSSRQLLLPVLWPLS